MKFVVIFILLNLPLWAQLPFPSPPDTLFGNVFDSLGERIDDTQTEIVVFADGVEVGRSSVIPHPSRNENYRIAVPTAVGSPDLRTYTVMLLVDEVPMSLTALPSGVFNFSPTASALTRFDFTLGEDLDDDGLPDGWELAQLAMIGSSDLNDLDPDDDLDFDGLSNRAEFIAGTVATDFESRIHLVVNDSLGASFNVVEGRLYQLEISSDGDSWAPVDFSILSSAASDRFLASQDQRITVTFAEATGVAAFYRIAVR